MMNSKCIFLLPGSLHLFLATGIYYLWELSKNFNIVLIVSEEYKHSPDFNKFITLAHIIEIVYLPESNAIQKHIFYVKTYKTLLRKYRPQYLLHHDVVYVSMMYLYHIAGKFDPTTKKYSYLTGVLFKNWEHNHKMIQAFSINSIITKYSFPIWFATYYFNIICWLKLVLNYYILPIILIGKVFSPPMNIFSFKILKEYWNDQFDKLILYRNLRNNLDIKIMKEYCGTDENFVQIIHPLKSFGSELNDILYDNIRESNVITILPSYGSIDYYKLTNKINIDELFNKIMLKWKGIIDSVIKKFDGCSLQWKLHPIQTNDHFWNTLTKKIKNEYPQINVLPPDANAQKLILMSKVVISDVSTVLWWTSLFTSKLAISFDVFGFEYMDDMQYFDNILYFSNLEDFDNYSFIQIDKILFDNSQETQLPTLTEFLNMN